MCHCCRRSGANDENFFDVMTTTLMNFPACCKPSIKGKRLKGSSILTSMSDLDFELRAADMPARYRGEMDERFLNK